MPTHHRPAAGPLLAATILVLSGLLESAAWARKPPRKDGGEDKPRLRLVADPAVGFTPVTAIFTGQLTGVGPRDPNFCHAAVTWIRIDPGQSEEAAFQIREDPACLHAPEEARAVTSFTKTFVLYRPGSYLVKLVVEGRDGTRVQSAYSKVEVLRVQ
jgi:hypothetical protein